MPIRAARTLALQKGYALHATSAPDRYRLVDNYNGLPALNHSAGLVFTLAEAVEFLTPLRDRVARQTST